MPTDPAQGPAPEDEPSHESPPPPDDPLLRAQSFIAERVAPLRPKGAAPEVTEAEAPADHFQEMMDEYRRRQQARATSATLPAADATPPVPPDAPAGTADQEEEP